METEPQQVETFFKTFTDYGAPYALLAASMWINWKLLTALIKSFTDRITASETQTKEVQTSLNNNTTAVNAMANKIADATAVTKAQLLEGKQ